MDLFPVLGTVTHMPNWTIHTIQSGQTFHIFNSCLESFTKYEVALQRTWGKRRRVVAGFKVNGIFLK